MSNTDAKLSYGIIAFFDILGTKNQISGGDIEKFVSKFTSFFESIEGAYGDPVGIRDRIPEECKYSLGGFFWLAFSDTIVIAFEMEEEKKLEEKYLSLKGVGLISADMIRNGLNHDFPVRGVISIGKFRHEGSPGPMIIGPAVYEAVEYSRVPKWIGISLAPSAHSILTKYFSETKKRDVMDNIFVRYDIPIDGGLEKDGYACNWVKVRNIFQCQDLPVPTQQDTDLRNKLIDKLSNDVKFKWRNTLSFLDYVNKKNPSP